MRVLRFIAKYHLELIFAFPIAYLAVWVITGIAIYGIH